MINCKLEYDDETLKSFLYHMKFYRRNYQTLDELDKHYNFVRYLFFDTIAYVNKQFGRINVTDYHFLSDCIIMFGMDRSYFVYVMYAILDFFRDIYEDKIILDSINNLNEYYKLRDELCN